MTTLSQFQLDEESWSLEEDDGELFIHHVAYDFAPRKVIPITLAMLEMMARRARSLAH
jgi:hypothetical protein